MVTRRLTFLAALLLIPALASGYPTRPTGISSSYVDSPLAGSGTSSSHLTCTLCVTTTGTQTLTNKIFQADDGAAATPAIGFDAETDLGFYRPSANTMRWTANGGTDYFQLTNTTLLATGTNAGGEIQFSGGAGLLLSFGGVDYVRLTTGSLSLDAGLFINSPYVRLTAAGAKPTCDSSRRGALYNEQGAGGVTDTLFCCMKSAADTYSWRSIVTGG